MAESPARARAERELFEALLELPGPRRRAALAEADAPPEVVAAVARLLELHTEDEGVLGAGGLVGLLGPPRLARLARGDRLIGRYTVRRHLGTGGFGSVYLALDELSERAVAIKLLDRLPPGLVPYVRDEMAWLRLLALPGVPRVLDEGEHAGCAWFAMEHVAGEPFPGAATPMPWQALRPRALALLDVLAQVHAAGLVHRDLKPGNVLVDASGAVTLLDFGISVSRGCAGVGEAARALPAGTPPYAAPEQFERVDVGPVADLHALGVMLVEALSGAHRFDALPADLPRRVRDTLEALMAVDPGERPADCHAVLQALHGELPPVPPVSWVSPRALRELFNGCDRLLHENEDAASELWRLSGGDERRGQAVLEGWVRMGLAQREGRRFVVRRATLDELRVRAALVSARGRSRGRPPDPARHAQRLEHKGFAAHALALRIDALRAARRSGRSAERRTAARALVLTALRLQRATDADRVLRELMPEHEDVQGVAEWCTLVQVGTHANHGDGRRALAELESLGALDDAELEGWRHTLAMRAAMSCGLSVLRRVHARALEGSATGGGPADQARRALWDGLLAYHTGDFAASARAHERSAELLELPLDVLRAELNAANAWLEALELDRCRSVAQRAGRRAAAWRLPQLEARAHCLERSARARACESLAPDPDFAQVVGRLGSTALEAQVLRTEAALAWRANRPELGRRLAKEAARAWSALGNPLGTALSRALAAVCGEPWEPPSLAHALQQAEDLSLPRVAAQLAALLVECGVEVPPGAARMLERFEPPARRDLRFEVLSWEELEQRLGGKSAQG